jgi:hypothetical protein
VQNPKYTFEGCQNKIRADICIPGDLLFIWGVVPSFRFRISVAASQKTDFGTLKMEKALFVGQNENRSPWRSSPSNINKFYFLSF